MPEHPMQPLKRETNGVIRFKRNEIVEWLWQTGHIDMNAITRMDFPAADKRQLAQLLGYSLYGYGDLRYVQPEDFEAALAASDMVYDEES
jgi:hypothetical protein